jgi:L-ascorbate metabolism protein UlaG (beta-lactamase superfamily)
VELDGLRILTDPVLRYRVLHLARRVSPVEPDVSADIDLVLISHMHADHFDPGSLRTIDRNAELVVPRGGGAAAGKLGFARVRELGEGESVRIGDVEVTATRAEHRRGRLLDKRSEAIGYLLSGSQRIYFAGDTDIFPGMRDLGRDLDVAFLPVWGWGHRLGPGHLDPNRAAEALRLLEPRVAVPIHWGTLSRMGQRRSRRTPAAWPPLDFARAAAEIAPAVDVRVLQPGESTTVER